MKRKSKKKNVKKENKRRDYVQVVDYYNKLINKEKYVGKRPITLRSSYEIRFVKRFLDPSEDVVEWSSEDVVIPYKYTVDDKTHRYFVDFWFKHRNGKEFLIEIKPYTFTQQPKVPKRKTQAYLRRCMEYEKNQNKWDAAVEYCRNVTERTGKSLEFKILTENELGYKK